MTTVRQGINGNRRNGAASQDDVQHRSVLGFNVGHWETDTHFLNKKGQLNHKIMTRVDADGNELGADVLLPNLQKFSAIRFMDWQKTNAVRGGEFHAPPVQVAEIKALDTRYRHSVATLQPTSKMFGQDVDWRPIPTDGNGGRPWRNFAGVPVQACLTFAKQCETHPWICLPHGVERLEDGGRRSNFTALMREIVDTVDKAQRGDRLPIYEFSNEVWNNQFLQHSDCAAMAMQELADIDASTNPYYAAAAWHAHCTLELATYVVEQKGGRGLIVLSGQTTEPNYLRFMLQRIAAQGKLHLLDAIAIAPYFGQKRFNYDGRGNDIDPLQGVDFASWTAAQARQQGEANWGFKTALNKLQQNIEHYIDGGHDADGRWQMGELDKGIGAHAKLCVDFAHAPDKPLQLWGYEGGQHLLYARWMFPDHDAEQVKLLFRALNRCSRIAPLHNRALAKWRKLRFINHAAGRKVQVQGGLLCAYSLSSAYEDADKFYGHLEYDRGKGRYLNRPKFQGLLERAVAFAAGTRGIPTMHAPTELVYVKDSQALTPFDLDLDAVPANSAFTVSWQIKNLGDELWGEGYRLRVAGAGRPMTAHCEYDLFDIANIDADGLATITLEMTAPDCVGQELASCWELVADNGELAELDPFVFIIVVADAPHSRGVWQSDSRWVSDRTIPDDSRWPTGKQLLKQWIVHNNGQRKWNKAYRLVYVGGDLALTGGKTAVVVPDTAAGQQMVLSLPLVVPPARPTPYKSVWRLQDDRGNLFGDRFWVQVIATAPPLAHGNLFHDRSGWYSQRDPRWHATTIGYGASSIDSWGCLLTCMAMTLTAYGDRVTPPQLNDRLLARDDGFIPDTSNVYFDALTKANTGMRLLGHYRADTHAAFAYDTTPVADLLGLIDRALADGRAVIAQVDRAPADGFYDSEREQHWVILVARAGEDYLMLDPVVAPPRELLGGLMGPYGGDKLQAALRSVLIYCHQ